jgi:hypothetical protein
MKPLIAVFSVAIATLAAAQPPDTLWTRTFGENSWDLGCSVQQTTDGGYIIAGNTGSDFNFDVCVIKTDTAGNQLWQRNFGGSNHEFAFSVRQTEDGGYIIVGDTYSYGAGGYDVYLIKTDSSGNMVWQRTLGGSGNECGYDVQQTNDGGYIITGFTNSYGAGYYDVYLVKTDTSGNQIWQRTFGVNSDDHGRSVQQTADGGYVIAGYNRYGHGYLVKTDVNGDSLWTRMFFWDFYHYGYSVQQTTDGGYIITGSKQSYSSGPYDVYLIKTDANGDTLWTSSYGGSNFDWGHSVEQTTDGGYIITGYTYSDGIGNQVCLIKTAGSGDLVWQSAVGGNYDDRGWCVQQTTDGGYVIAGYTQSYGAGPYHLYLIKTDVEGTPVAPSINPNQPQDFVFDDPHPNPFNASTAISYELRAASNVSLRIYDTAGRLVSTLVEGWRAAGTHEVIFDGSSLASGIYLAKLEASGSGTTPITEVQKMVLLK